MPSLSLIISPGLIPPTLRLLWPPEVTSALWWCQNRYLISGHYIKTHLVPYFWRSYSGLFPLSRAMYGLCSLLRAVYGLSPLFSVVSGFPPYPWFPRAGLSILIKHESCLFVHVFRSHQKSKLNEILALGLIWANLKPFKGVPIWSSVKISPLVVYANINHLRA